jgi:hypothetical protein
MVDEIYIPKGNLNIPREKMPQIHSKDVPRFMDYLRDAGIRFQQRDVTVTSLKPSQREINIDKVRGMMKAPSKVLHKPVIVSKDKHIMDGHHRWLALVNLDGNDTIPTYFVNLRMRELIVLARGFEKVAYKNIHERRAFAKEILDFNREIFGFMKKIIEKGKGRIQKEYHIHLYDEYVVDFFIDLHVDKSQRVAFDIHGEIPAEPKNADADSQISMEIIANPFFFPMAYNDLNAEIKEVLRHEYEHLAQDFGKRGDFKSIQGKTFKEYMLLPTEIAAFLSGWLTRAKTQRMYMDDIMDEYLNGRKYLFRSKREIEEVRRVYRQIGMKKYPNAKWRER